jgi:SAM-dependent methyltransferase
VSERRAIESDAQAIAAFYGTKAGLVARRAILAQLHAFWPNLNGLRLLGFGFAAPYLTGFRAERVIAASPARMGLEAGAFALAGAGASVLCEEDALPFADALFDRVLVIHGLERAEALRPLLRQIWRVMAPEGRLLVVTPNRASLWAQVERTPFGQGRPFGRTELDRLLREALFEPRRWQRALYAPPFGARLIAANGRHWEKAGSLLFPALGGVHVVEAGKTIYAATPLPVAEAVVSAAVPAGG